MCAFPTCFNNKKPKFNKRGRKNNTLTMLLTLLLEYIVLAPNYASIDSFFLHSTLLVHLEKENHLIEH